MDVAAEEESKRKRRAAKKAQEIVRHESRGEPEEKRRRISIEDDSEDEKESSDEEVSRANNKSETPHLDVKTDAPLRSPSPRKPPQSPVSLAKRYESTIAAANITKKPVIPSNVIDLEEDDEEEEPKEQTTTHTHQHVDISPVTKAAPPEYDDFPAEDEEFPELARRAREKARSKRLQTDSVAAVTSVPVPPPAHYESPITARQPPQTNQPSLAAEPVVSILLTSPIPNTNPLIVNRKLTQRLKDVRLAWCQRQDFAPETTATVILTWRGKRIFDVSSCKSLGIGVDAKGNIVMKGEKDMLGEEDRQIHMVAMTDEMFAKHRKAQDRKMDDDTQQDDTIDEVPVAEPQAEESVRIILKAKGYSEFKLIVKPVSIRFVFL